MSATTAVLRGELALLRRDPMAPVVLAIAWLPALLVRFGWDEAVAAAAPWVDLAPFRPLLAMWLLQLPGLLVGWVVGFTLLDERDDGVLPAIAVSPWGRLRFGALRSLWAILGGFVIGIACVQVAGLDVPVDRLLAGAAMAALDGPVWAALLLALASDKVAGLALTKLLNLSMLAPVAWVAAPAPWGWLAAWMPTFWVGPAIHGPLVPALVGGLVVHAAWLALAARLLRRRLA